MTYSSEVQQWLCVELPGQPLERLERLGGGNLGVNVHRHVDLRMAQDAHSNARMHVERSKQRGAGVTPVVHGDPPNPRLGAPRLDGGQGGAASGAAGRRQRPASALGGPAGARWPHAIAVL